jgi:pyruvate,water dikinase
MVEGYAAMPDNSDPRLREGVLRAEREKLEGEVLAALPAPLRPVVKGVFKRASHCIPLRGVAKGAFLQAFDICRASARRTGECLAKEGKLVSHSFLPATATRWTAGRSCCSERTTPPAFHSSDSHPTV